MPPKPPPITTTCGLGLLSITVLYMIPTGVHGLEKFSSRKRTCSFDPSFGAGCRWPISARHLVTDRVRIRSARSSFVDAPRAAGSCLDDSDRGVHSRDGIPGTLLRSGNGRDVPYGQSNHLDCRRWIDLSGDALVICSFDGSRRNRCWAARRAVLATTILFAAAHIPNPILTIGSALAGFFFCEMFRRYRNIFPLGLVHVILGLAMAASVSDALLHHMRVGIGFVQFH